MSAVFAPSKIATIVGSSSAAAAFADGVAGFLTLSVCAVAGAGAVAATASVSTARIADLRIYQPPDGRVGGAAPAAVRRLHSAPASCRYGLHLLLYLSRKYLT